MVGSRAICSMWPASQGVLPSSAPPPPCSAPPPPLASQHRNQHFLTQDGPPAKGTAVEQNSYAGRSSKMSASIRLQRTKCCSSLPSSLVRCVGTNRTARTVKLSTWAPGAVAPSTAASAAASVSAAPLPAAGRLVEAAGGGAAAPSLAEAAALSAVAHRLSRFSGSLHPSSHHSPTF